MFQIELHVIHIHSQEAPTHLTATEFQVRRSLSNTNFIRTHISFTISSTCDINTAILAIFVHFILASVTMATKLLISGI